MNFLAPGSRLGRFEISSVLGQGAMGVVYLANDPQIGRPVAIKTVRPGMGRDESALEIEERLRKEARLAGRLQHPNIVTIYDVGRDGDEYFIAMEYVDGKSLTRYLVAPDDLPLAAKIAIVRQTAEALSHAHERGVLHRDIKPGNILIARDGRVKVTDFGIGRFTTATTSDLTRTGQMIGSPAYMSPEQVRGEKLDGRSDLFSLGVVLYELLTAVRPFPGESITTLVYQILHTEPRDPLELKADLPAATRQVMARLLAKQPEKRPEDARAFLQELSRIESFQRESEMTRRAVAPAAAANRVAQGANPPAPPTVLSAPSPAAPRTPAAPPSAASEGATEFWAAPPPPTPPSPSTVLQGPPPRRTPGLPILLLAVAVLILAGVLLFLGRGERALPASAGPATPAPAIRATSAPGAVASDSAPATEPESSTTSMSSTTTTAAEPITELPTPGPREAAGATVGVPRAADGTTEAARIAGSGRPRPTARPARVPTPVEVARAEPAPALREAPPADGGAGAGSSRVDHNYATRRSVRFTSSPDQARLIIDGRAVGIADDWDNRGGGRAFEFDRSGPHDVRMELPGYRTMQLRIDVSPDAEKDSISIDEELERIQRVSYEKLPAVSDRTTGAVEFVIDPPDAVVSEGGKPLGAAASFTAASPLQLRGPQVHDLLLSAPGRKPRPVRILVSSNAGRDRAVVKEKLKAE
ncbi:MAG TPA: protein kinase [Thermoanaerobaculia bacterium]